MFQLTNKFSMDSLEHIKIFINVIDLIPSVSTCTAFKFTNRFRQCQSIENKICVKYSVKIM